MSLTDLSSAYAEAQLEDFAVRLYTAAGMAADMAQSVARLQVLTDAMGRMTHGLAMAPLYLKEIEKGTMATTGQPVIVRDLPRPRRDRPGPARPPGRRSAPPAPPRTRR